MEKSSLIFVSHSHRDNDWCRDFVRGLRKRGADVWYDEQSLGFGRLAEAITREMLNRSVFIPIFTPAAVTSKWVQREMEAAIYLQDKDPDRIVLPVIAARCDVPPLWVTFRRVSGPDDAPLAAEAAVTQVAEALHLGAAKVQDAAVEAPPLRHPDAHDGGPLTPAGRQPGKTALTDRPGFRLFAHAITDVYDEDLKRSLVAYPLWLSGSLLVTGLIAFLLAGLLATNLGPAPAHPGAASWPVYIWMGLLGLALEVTILRHPSLRRYAVMLVVASAIALAVVGIAVYDGALFQRPLGIISSILLLRPNSVVFVLVNVGILAIYLFLSIRRWVRRASGLPISSPRVDLGTSVVPDEVRQRTLAEIIFGDLVAGGIIALLLAGALHIEVLNGVVQALQLGGRIDPCAVAWPFGRCILASQPGLAAPPPTLATVNLIVCLVLIPLGLLLAALQGLVSGLGALSAADPGIRSLSYDTRSVGTEVAVTIIATLRSSLDRLFRLSVQAGALAIRDIAWPALIVLWTVAAAATAYAALAYFLPHSACSLPACITARLISLDTYVSAMYTLVWGIVAICGLTGAVGFLLFSQRVVTNTLRFVVRVMAHGLLTYWLFVLALAAVAQGLVFSHVVAVNPYPFLDPVGLASLALAFVGGQILLFRRIMRFYGASTAESS